MTNKWYQQDREHYIVIRRGIEQAMGPGNLTALRSPKRIGPVFTSWPQFYPLAWLPAVLADDYELNGIRAELIELNTDWVELADWFAVINHQQQQLPVGEPSP